MPPPPTAAAAASAVAKTVAGARLQPAKRRAAAAATAAAPPTPHGMRSLSSAAGAGAAQPQPVLGAYGADVATIRASLPPAVATLLKDYPSVITLPVQWGEMDSYRHLNNVVYARYFETGRMAFVHQVLEPRLPAAEFARFVSGRDGVGMILGAVGIRYKAPVTFPDTLTLGVRVAKAKVGSDRFVQDFAAVSHKLGRVVADGDAVMVMYDYTVNAKADIPDSIRTVLLEKAY
ncbi:hypothetical protein HK405_002804 [Cladochytrium tenue]|nr:hypothetical protein HK405_002804 [Cladochytrium tenue]